MSPLSPADWISLPRLLTQTAHPPYRYLRHQYGEDAISGFLLDDIVGLEQHGGRVFVACCAGDITALVTCADLPWDSRVLGNHWASLKHVLVAPQVDDKASVLGPLLDEAIAWARQQGVECLACKVQTDDTPAVHALETRGFLYMDTLLDYVVGTANSATSLKAGGPTDVRSTSDEAAVIRLARRDDTEGLMDLARLAFGQHFSRYMVDPRIPAERSRNVYAEWMRASVEGYADWICVATNEGRIVGYSVWKKPSAAELRRGLRIGHYSIAGIHPEFAGKGLFTSLTAAGMGLLADHADCIEGPTHVNSYAVQRGYDRLGWRIEDARHSFHRWLI